MTREEAVDLGRKWVDAGWTWTERQPVIFLADCRWYAGTVVRKHGSGLPAVSWLGGSPVLEVVPDVRDPGFIGHALAQVRAAWGDEYEWTLYDDGGVGYERPGTQNGLPCTVGRGFDDLLAARKAAP